MRTQRDERIITILTGWRTRCGYGWITKAAALLGVSPTIVSMYAKGARRPSSATLNRAENLLVEKGEALTMTQNEIKKSPVTANQKRLRMAAIQIGACIHIRKTKNRKDNEWRAAVIEEIQGFGTPLARVYYRFRDTRRLVSSKLTTVIGHAYEFRLPGDAPEATINTPPEPAREGVSLARTIQEVRGMVREDRDAIQTERERVQACLHRLESALDRLTQICERLGA